MASKQQIQNAAKLASIHEEDQYQRMRTISRDQDYTSPAQKPEIEQSTTQQPEAQSAGLPAQFWDYQSQHGAQQGEQHPAFDSRNTRITNTHILFWHGPLSNWSTDALFSGARVLEFLLPRLDAARIHHPSEKALSTKLLARHNFNCGEQFMMACKGWLFERDQKVEAISETLPEEEMERLCRMVMGEPEPWSTSTKNRSPRGKSRSPPRSRSRSNSPNKQATPEKQRDPTPDDQPRIPAAEMAKWRNSTIARVLSTYQRREQKALGRQARNFNDKIWNPASKHVVVAASIARAETNEKLRKFYHFAGKTIPQTQTQTQPQPQGQSPSKNHNSKGARTPSPKKGTNTIDTNTTTTEKITRTFVEGSPVDRIWGVGLRWNEGRCDDERNWRGENRLGRCHDEAAKYVRENATW